MCANGILAKYIRINSFLLFRSFFLLVMIWVMPGYQYAQDNIRLAPPVTKALSVFFQQSACVQFEFRMQGAVIRYTINGDEPNEYSTIYKEPICINSTVIIKAKSFSTGFLPSSSVSVQCIKTTGAIRSIEGTNPESQYNKGGLKRLFDLQPGGLGPGDGWLGFRKDTIEWVIHFSKKQKTGKIHIGLMRSQGSWIFYPEIIELIFFNGKSIGQKMFTADPAPDEKNIFSFPVKKKISGLIVRIQNYSTLPEWHPGKGNKPWLFIDEIAVE